MNESATKDTSIKVSWGKIASILRERFACMPQPMVAGGQEAILMNEREALISCFRFLRDELNYSILLMINAVEYKDAVQLIYQLQTLKPHYETICLKLNLDRDDLCVPTATDLWHSADWYEREIWEMHGIVFEGHPNLKRLLNPDTWEGFPLRKDYIPPLDALNGPITAVKSDTRLDLDKHTRADIEFIVEPNQISPALAQPAPDQSSSS